MNRTKILRGVCQQCGGPLQFPAEIVGTTSECPLCHATTELVLETPESEPAIPRRIIVWSVVGMIILLSGLVLSFFALNRVRTLAGRAKKNSTTAMTNSAPVENPEQKIASTAGFGISPIELQKSTNTTLIYAVGTLTNKGAKQRFGVAVTVEIRDEQGKILGTATDYQATMEPNADWTFRALVPFSKAANARLTGIKERL